MLESTRVSGGGRCRVRTCDPCRVNASVAPCRIGGATGKGRPCRPDSATRLHPFLHRALARPAVALFALLLAACGGGGSDRKAAEATHCPAVFRVLAVGDSTMRGTGDMLQVELDARLGKGRAVVWNRGQNGATSADGLKGYEGQRLDLLLAEVDPHIVVSNYGMGDMRDNLGVEGYASRLREIRALVGDALILQTPNPATQVTPYGSERAEREIADYTEAVRVVAADTGTPLADVRAFVLSLEGWQGIMADGIHPGPELHRQIVRGVTAPAVVEKMGGCA